MSTSPHPYADRAEALFYQGHSCAQSVAAPFAPLLGLTETQVLTMMSGFGAGFGRMREVCGAFSGVTFVLSALYGDPAPGGKTPTYAMIQSLAEQFREKSGGSLICRALLGLERPEGTAVASQRTEAYYAARPCPRLVRMGAELIEDYLAEHPRS